MGVRTWLFWMVPVLVACEAGSANEVPPEPRDPIRAVVDVPDGQLPPGTRGALLWWRGQSDWDASERLFRTTQELNVRPTASGHFELDLPSRPPDEAMARVALGFEQGMQVQLEGAWGASAHVLLYLDDNYNGRLDLVPLDGEGADRFTDRVFAAATLDLTYYEGSPKMPPPGWAAGFHLREYYVANGVVLTRLLPVASTDVAFSAEDPEALSRRFLCPEASFRGGCGLGVECAGPPELRCREGSFTIEAYGCHQSAALCGARSCDALGTTERRATADDPSCRLFP